jgi:hypothetical protein
MEGADVSRIKWFPYSPPALPVRSLELDPDGYWFANVDLAARRGVLDFRDGFEDGSFGSWLVVQ